MLMIALGVAAGPQAAPASATPQDEQSSAWWSPDGTSNSVTLWRTLRNGHHYISGTAVTGPAVAAVYYDRSDNGGRSWKSFVDRRYVSGYTATYLPEHYDDGGVWYRICGASEWRGDPYGNPAWGLNIACSNWF
ncbi:hypothetical protein PL81_40265 [Streptomyces sp. RSD-27]|nr:hypothetical protein PL81_40265 [Streptomyces sp. RSD-27]